MDDLKLAWIAAEQAALDKFVEYKKLQEQADKAKEKYRKALWEKSQEENN